MEEYNFMQVFGADAVPGKPEIYLAKPLGLTAGGETILPVQERANGKVLRQGKLLYFRNNNLADLKFAGKVAEDGYAHCINAGISRDGAWLFVKGANTIDTAGYGAK